MPAITFLLQLLSYNLLSVIDILQELVQNQQARCSRSLSSAEENKYTKAPEWHT